MKMRKFECSNCDSITLTEFRQPIEPLYSCPACMNIMEYLEEMEVEGIETK